MYKKESHKPLPARTLLLLYKYLFLLAFPNGQDLSNVLITQTIRAGFVSNLYLSTGSQHFLLIEYFPKIFSKTKQSPPAQSQWAKGLVSQMGLISIHQINYCPPRTGQTPRELEVFSKPAEERPSVIRAALAAE